MREPGDFDGHLPVPSLVERFVPDAKEIAVLVAYAKITVFAELVRSDVPDDPFMERALVAETYSRPPR